MSLKKMSIGSGVLVLLALLVYTLNSGRNEPQSEGRVGRSVLDGVRMEEAARVVISDPRNRVTMENNGPDGWKVLENNGLPADSKKMNTMLSKMSDIILARRISGKNGKLAELKLENPGEGYGQAGIGPQNSAPQGPSMSFSVFDKQGQPMFSLYLGKSRQVSMGGGDPGQYIRLAGDDDAYLIGESLYMQATPEDWISKTLLDVHVDSDLKSMTIAAPGGAPLEFSRKEPGLDWELTGTPAEKLKKQEVKSMASTLATLKMVHVAPTDKTPADLGRSRSGTVVVDLFDNRRYTLSVGADKGFDDYRYLTIEAALSVPASDEKASLEVERFNRLYKGQFFAIHDFEAKRLQQERKAFLQEAQ
ncbi:MAG: DUF4340 domain-containing protein [Deltaproteobacteria bacterium]|nr:DUF4340 domain-containing protein [Deltaproteobacteria bacterium]